MMHRSANRSATSFVGSQRRASARHGIAALAALSAAALATPGCIREGGPGWSGAPVAYVSTEHQPKTLTLTDTRTGAELWAVDIPVGKQLVVNFSRGTGPNAEYPDEIVWSIMEAGRRFGSQDHRLPVPAASSRRLEMTLRPGPERVGDPMAGNPFDPGYDTPVGGPSPQRGVSGN
jgi:hypothetical protein